MRLASINRLLACLLFFYSGMSPGQTNLQDNLSSGLQSTAGLSEADINLWLSKARDLTFAQPDSAIVFANRALEVSHQLGLSSLVAESYKRLGNIHYGLASFDEALKNYSLSLEIFTESENEEGMAGVLNNLGIIHKNLGNYPQAADAYYQSLELAEKIGDNMRTARVYRNLGSIYFLQDDYEKGIASFEKSLQLLHGENDPQGIAESHFNLGAGYLVEKKYAKAESSLLESMAHFEKLPPGPRVRYHLAEVFNNLGILYRDQEKLSQARKSHEQAIAIRDSLGDLVGLAESYANLAALDIQEEKYHEALEKYQRSREIAEGTGSRQITQSVLLGMAEAHEGMGDFRLAYQFHKQYAALKDSLFSSENIRRIANAEMVYQRAREREKQLIQEKALAEQKMLNYLLIAGLTVALLLTAITLLVLRNYMIRQKGLKTQLAHKEQLNRQIVLDLLHEHELETLDAHLEGREKERLRIATDLHDSLGGTLAAVQLSLSTLKKKMKGVADEALRTYEKTDELLDQAYKEMRRISHNLADGTLKEGGLLNALHNMKSSLSENSSLNIHLNLDTLRQISLDRDIELHLYRILQELFQNIVKHANARKVDVDFARNKSKLVMTVRDDGKGFDYDHQTEAGMGLKNIRSRVQQLSGQLSVNSAPGEGTEVKIEVLLDWQIN